MNKEIRVLSDHEKTKRMEFLREITALCKIYCMTLVKAKTAESYTTPVGRAVWKDNETIMWKE